MGGIAKIQAELAKGKTCVEVQEKIERVLTDGDTMIALLNKTAQV